MSLRQSVRRAAIAACLSAVAAAADAAWHAVPGAPDVDIELGSMQIEHSRVVVWLRWWGRHSLVPELASQGARGPRIQRTALRMEFDCSQRTVRVLAANAYASSGAPTFMSSTPGPAQPVAGDDLGWAYDAVCEAARADRRL